MARVAGVRAAICVGVLTLGAPAIHANRESEALRVKGAEQLYNLDREQALTTFRQAVATDNQDPAAYRGLATSLWLNITFRRGNMTVDDYLGRVTKPNQTLVPPPPEIVTAYKEAIDHAI